MMEVIAAQAFPCAIIPEITQIDLLHVKQDTFPADHYTYMNGLIILIDPSS